MSRGKAKRVRTSTAQVTLFIAAIAAFLGSATSAFGAQTHVPAPFSPIVGASTGVALSAPSGIAVDEGSGNVFVNDGGGDEVTDIFSATGGLPTGVASPYQISGFAFFGEPSGAAVDNSATSPAQGTLYVVDVANSQVKIFVRNAGTELYEETGELTPSDGTPFGEPLGAAVDSHGNVFIGDYASESVVEFSPAGAQIDRISTSETVGTPSSVAVDGAGDLFVQGYPEGSAVFKYSVNGSGELESEVFTEVVEAGATGVAVDQATNRLYVGLGDHVNAYDATSLAKKEEFGSGSLTESTRLAVNSSTGRLYVSDVGAGDVAVFVPITLADATTHKATALKTEAATLNGEVNPNGLSLVECNFEYGESESYGEVVPCAETPGQIGSGNAGVKVHADISGLGLETAYHFRLVVSNHCNAAEPAEVCLTEGQDSSFTTATPPEVSAEAASKITAESANLEGLINPKGQPTKYQFEYLTEAAWEANGKSFSGSSVPTKIPASPASIGSSTSVPVTEKINGLSPATKYRFRLTATNETDTTSGPGAAFATYSPPSTFKPCSNDAIRSAYSTNLPDCRAYEQASPVDKNGGSLQAIVFSTKASVNGDAITFESPAGVPGGEGSQEFPTYLAKRGPAGWSTRGLLPPASTGTHATVAGWMPDFSQAFDTAGSFDTGAFLMRSTSNGSTAEISPYTKPFPQYSFAGASADGTKIFFEAGVPGGALTSDAATDKTNLYVWNRGTEELHLAGLLAGNATPPGGSVAGSHGNSSYNQDMHAVSNDGSVYFTEPEGGQLYLRQDPTGSSAQTLHVSASHRTTPDPGGPLRANFEGASTDGSVAYFTSEEELTDDAHTIAIPNVISSANLDGSGVNPAQVLGANAAAVDVDAGHIYWADTANDSIGRADLNGENVEPNFITGADNPKGVAVDGTHIYWTNASIGTAGTGSIGRADLNGSGPPSSVSQSCVTGASNPLGIDLDSSFIYWVNAGESAIGRADLACTPASVNQSFITEKTNNAVDVTVDTTGAYLFIARGAFGNIARVNRDGSAGGIFLPFVVGANAIGADSSHLYWTTSTGTIARSELDGTGVSANFLGVENPQGLALDGSHVYWGSHPSGRGADLYRYEAVNGDLTDLTPYPQELRGGDVKGVLGASSDGSYVYFVANGVPEGILNSPNKEGEVASPGSCQGPQDSMTGICNLYLWHDDGSASGSTTFIGRLDSSGGVTGDVSDWISTDGVFSEREIQKTARVTPDGQTVLFRSWRRLTKYDNKGQPEFYLFRADDKSFLCVTCNPTGVPPVATTSPLGPAILGTIVPPVVGAPRPAPILSRNLSSDGNRFFFESIDPLVAADTNGEAGCPPWGSALQKLRIRACQDVYEWEAKGTGSCESEAQNGGCIYLLSTGKSPDASFFADASANGDNAFIFTYEQLAGQDKDHLLDVYDVRAGGGLASQSPPEVAACTGEACKSPPSPPPPTQSPGSAGFSGQGNQKPARHHKKKRHGKRHHKKHHRNAKKTGRASR